MPKVDKRESVRLEKAEPGSSRGLRVRAALGLRGSGKPIFEQTGLRSSKEREDLQIHQEVAALFSEASKYRFDEDRIERELVSKWRLRDREEFETLCDASMAF